MSDWSIRAGTALVLAVAVGFTPCAVSAEPALFTGTGCVGPSSVVPDAYGCSPVDVACSSSPPATCLAFLGGNICIPDDTPLICCGTYADCPMPGGTSGRCVHLTGLGTGLCIDPVRNYCAAGDPSAEVLRNCHSGPDGAWGPYEEGDCDDDGLSNGELRGYSIAPAGDWNADTYGDVIVGIPFYDLGPGGPWSVQIFLPELAELRHVCRPQDDVHVLGDGLVRCHGTHDVVRIWQLPGLTEIGNFLDREIEHALSGKAVSVVWGWVLA